jgi:DNA (cytosine-5)-methyltransferase 1
MLTVGSLCTGIGGLELALRQVLTTELLWVSETDPSASQVLEHRFGVPNLGDLTEISKPPKVDIVMAGFPCQPVSYAGERKGIDDKRWLIKDVCRVASEAQARFLILENVRGLLTANDGEALARVCAEMAYNGFGRWEWDTLRASRVGTPHRRDRWFCIATNSKGSNGRWSQHEAVVETIRQATELRERNSKDASIADTAGWGLQGVRARNRLEESEGDTATFSSFGPYEPAIRRWEAITGVMPPHPVCDRGVEPAFVEWIMGFDKGWVTDLGLSMTAELKTLGNAVVPLQGAVALGVLLQRLLEI